ncbi:calcium-binding protein [Jannaschia sp. S6380]|uniref:calcium-binding protein n=1 Tax=Jannaschia sp. S6380 TaxID=2926408 RepID=UPI001FF0E1C6|nr:calcium-binding protein [Jannaschia sp. S6380]MCK0168314.1 calcium-binding protein [Jannaschia sp. S6380]
MTLTFIGMTLPAHDDRFATLSDLDLVHVDGQAILFATDPNGRIFGHAIAADGELVALNDRGVGMDRTAGTSVATTVQTTAEGVELLVGGRRDGAATLTIGSDGRLDIAQDLPSGAPAAVDVSVAVEIDDGLLVTRAAGGAGLALSAGGAGLADPIAVAGTGPQDGARGVADLAHANIGGRQIVFAAAQGDGYSQADSGVSSWTADAGGLRPADIVATLDGVGFMVPTSIATATVAGETWLILASAQGASGGLSVMHVDPEGQMLPVDHVNDTRDTRFGGARAVETLNRDGVVYVAAGGTDGGISLFVLMPDGKLVLIDSFEDTLTAGLADVTAIAMEFRDGAIQIYVTSESEVGITHLRHAPGKAGRTLRAEDDGPVRLSGTSGLDLIAGGAGSDTLDGGGRDDILSDGAGADRMTGGWGHDTFVLASDRTADVITDFNPRHDRLDLGAWPFLYDVNSLSILSTADGARIEWRGEVLTLIALDLAPIPPEEVRAAILRGPNRTFRAPDMTLTGGAEDDALQGSWGRDVLQGHGGGDVLEGGDAPDLLLGGDGRDTLAGENGNDTLMGEAGSDLLLGGRGHDLLEGGADTDTLRGDAGNDTLLGGAGDDDLDGDTGDDELDGGAGWDRLAGGDGGDTLLGAAGDDTLTGDRGADRLDGGDGADHLSGGRDADTLLGGDGDDSLFAGAGADRLAGGAGVDRLVGGEGDDRLDGGSEDDHLSGEQGDDWIGAGRGDDTLFAGGGMDTLAGGRGADLLVGGGGSDELSGNNSADHLSGGGGSDRLFGGRGADTLWGGDGGDVAEGGRGDDRILGEAGADRAAGGNGGDHLSGGGGGDHLSGGAGRDTIAGDYGADTLLGEDDADELLGGAGQDRLDGGSGDDGLSGGGGRDTLIGGHGGDRLDGGRGNDVLRGGDGADVFVFRASAGRDRVEDFRLGADRILLDRALVGDAETGAQIVARYARETAEGVLLDLPGDDAILLHDMTGLTGLAEAIDIM